MAEISVKASLHGAAETQRGIESLNQSMKGMNESQAHNATVLQNLQRLAEEHRRGLEQRAQATQKLKDHTADLVRKFNEAERAAREKDSAMSKLAGTFGSMILRIGGTIFAVSRLVALFKDIFSSGHEADMVMVKLEASLAATGNAAGLTANQLEEMSKKLAQGTLFDNTAIQQSINVLLTFDNVRGEVFEGAIRHAENLSAKFGIELPQATRMLGRALQEPGEGLQALSKYIGTINSQTLDYIKSLDDSGQSEEARAEILKLLDSRMKGFAETVGTSAPAAFDRMKVSWGNMLEEMGRGMSSSPVFDKLAKFFEDAAIAIDYYPKFVNEKEKERVDNELKATEEAAVKMTARRKELNAQLRRMDEEERSGGADPNDWRRRNTKRIIDEELAEIAKAQQRRTALLQFQQDLLNAQEKKNQQEQQDRAKAAQAAKAKQEEEAAQKRKEHEQKLLKENEELAKKIEAGEMEATQHRLEMLNFELEQEKITRNDALRVVQDALTFEMEGSATWKTLKTEELKLLKELKKADEDLVQQAMQRYDVEIKMGNQPLPTKYRS
jgi:phage-related minor tail protein